MVDCRHNLVFSSKLKWHKNVIKWNQYKKIKTKIKSIYKKSFSVKSKSISCFKHKYNFSYHKKIKNILFIQKQTAFKIYKTTNPCRTTKNPLYINCHSEQTIRHSEQMHCHSEHSEESICSILVVTHFLLMDISPYGLNMTNFLSFWTTCYFDYFILQEILYCHFEVLYLVRNLTLML